MNRRKPRTNKSWQAMKNNAQGHFFEGYISGACGYYKDTTLEAAICGADYTECECIEDMARVYARWFTERYGN